MFSNEQIGLSDYIPKSELINEEHLLTKPKFTAIDMHTHFGKLVMGDNYEKLYDTGEIVEKLKRLDMKYIVNLDGFWGAELDRMLKKIHPYEDYILTFGAVDITKLDDADFEKHVHKTLLESKEKGIRGLKFWKNISLVLKDKNGKHIPVDDARLKVIWETAAELDLPVLIHIADPKAFFKTIDKYNERYEELHAHPDWAFNSPDLFKFEELMDMQENLLASNPKTTFVVAHVGSKAEDLGYVSRCLDKYSNMYVDTADRLAELGRQPYSSRKFFEKYQDRIVFGTDGAPFSPNYEKYFRFAETWDEYFDYSAYDVPPQGRWSICGIGLEDQILEKFYYKNAAKILKLK